jgi:hypothetical protein
LGVGCWLFLLLISTRAADEWILLPEPKFMSHKGAQSIDGAKSTVLAPARLGKFGPDFPNADEWKNDGLSDDAILAATRALAAPWLKDVKPELVRGKNKVVEYARLQSDKVPLCAAVLTPEFARQFEEIFGPKPLVVIPNRYTIFIFPALAGKHERFAPLILAAWHSRAPKVSLEVFELGDKGLRAVGAFEE